MDLQISERARRVLTRLSKGSLADALDAFAAEVLRARLRHCIEEIGEFEARRGRTFEEFAADWNAGRVPERSSHSVEREHMEWEALTIERQHLLRELRGFLDEPDPSSSGVR